ncbi:hypothetical protein Bca52824_019088 [Brassica carinata]|uniref:Uncharacterized protein n=1 Tax=Brassica carinata TaxID=52824 RepID=A0A8X7VR81_BRACI|nr:hypothetical protein Bca52824_019088 [Brassica carinata]
MVNRASKVDLCGCEAREFPSFFVGLVVTSIGYGVPYKFLDGMVKPSVSDDGELIDGGFDMSTGGICGYLHDVLYITCFVQLASIISVKFWYTYLVVGLSQFLHLERTKLLGLLEDSCHKVQREVYRMRKLAKRGRRWREKLLEGNKSGQDHDECAIIIFSNFTCANQRATILSLSALQSPLLYGCSCLYTI